MPQVLLDRAEIASGAPQQLHTADHEISAPALAPLPSLLPSGDRGAPSTATARDSSLRVEPSPAPNTSRSGSRASGSAARISSVRCHQWRRKTRGRSRGGPQGCGVSIFGHCRHSEGAGCVVAMAVRVGPLPAARRRARRAVPRDRRASRRLPRDGLASRGRGPVPRIRGARVPGLPVGRRAGHGFTRLRGTDIYTPTSTRRPQIGSLVAAAASVAGLRLWTLDRRHYPMSDVVFHDT